MSTNAKNVYYVLKYVGSLSGTHYYVGVGGGHGNLSGALRFSTVADLLRSGAARYSSVDRYIVRVEETPGTTELRIVSKTIIDPRKPVVLYDRERKSYIRRSESNPLTLTGRGVTLDDAVVFSDVEDALVAFAKSFAILGNRFAAGIPVSIAPHIYQVELVTTEPTITETVLQ